MLIFLVMEEAPVLSSMLQEAATLQGAEFLVGSTDQELGDIYLKKKRYKLNVCLVKINHVPSNRSIVISSTKTSHHRKCWCFLPCQFSTSNLLSLLAKYIKATARISGSH